TVAERFLLPPSTLKHLRRLAPELSALCSTVSIWIMVLGPTRLYGWQRLTRWFITDLFGRAAHDLEKLKLLASAERSSLRDQYLVTNSCRILFVMKHKLCTTATIFTVPIVLHKALDRCDP